MGRDQPVQYRLDRCAWCGKHLTAGRSHKRFDSQNCRKAFSRWKAKMRTCSSEAKQAIDCLVSYIEHDDTKAECAKRLRTLQEYLEAINLKLVELEFIKP